MQHACYLPILSGGFVRNIVALGHWPSACGMPLLSILGCVCLPAIMSTETNGRDMHGIIVLVRSDYRVSSLNQQCTDFGEYVVVVLKDSLQLVVCYHNGSHSFASKLDDSMHLFSDTAATIPTLYIGNFNWSMHVPLSVPTWV